MKTRFQSAIALIVAPFLLSIPAIAADQDADGWQFGVAIPLWAPRIDGNATVHGQKKDVSVSFDELKDHLEASFSLGLEARKDKFGLFTDFGYMKFTGDASGAGNASARDELKFIVADAGVSYRLIKTETEHPFILEAIAGVRYWYVENDLRLRGPLGNILVDSSANKDLVDPIVGFRGSQFFTQKLHMDFLGTIGGFGISDTQADIDWSAGGLLSYDFARWFTLSAGYQALAVKYEKGSGTDKHGVDLVFNGALVTAKFKF